MTSGHLQKCHQVNQSTGSMAKATFSMSSCSQSNWLDDEGLTVIRLARVTGWMAGGLGKLRGMIKPDGDHVWNGSGTIEDSAGSLESQIDDRRTALINND